MICIKIDTYSLSKEEHNYLVVRNESQFIESRLKIRDALNKGKELNVIIKNKKISRWYESLRDYSDIKIEIVTPHAVLSKVLKLPSSLSINLPLSDSDIQELGLIKKAETNPPQTRIATVKDMEGWVLSVCIGECWAEKGGTLNHLSKMVSFFLKGKEYERHLTLKRLMEKQKERWVNSEVGKAYEWLFSNPYDRSFLVYAWQILKNYDMNVKEKILDEITENNRKVLEPIEKYLAQIPPCNCSDDYKRKSEFSDLLEIRWKNILKSRLEYKKSELQGKKDEMLKQRFKEIINDVITKMSGEITGEVNALMAFVRENAFYFSKELFELIAAKFSLFRSNIEELRQLILQEIPSEPLLQWDWNQISKWAIFEYFPYKKWSLRRERRDWKIEKIAEKYEEWLYSKYPELKNELFPLIYGTWYKIKNYIQQGYHILWIIIDNLCWFYVEDIINAFKKQGLYPKSEPTLRLAMLPSETRFSKTALFAGKLPNQIRQDKYQDYSELLEESCKATKISNYIIIPSNQAEKVFKCEKIGSQLLICCMINTPDISAHKDFYGLERWMKSFFESVAEDIKTFISPHPYPKQFLVVVSTDHGSCKIPKHASGLKMPQCKREAGKQKRFIYLNSNQTLDENWYFLDKNRFGLLESIAVVKGYGFIGNRKPKGLVHGGMTPEETLIPYFEFCLQPLEIKAIQCFHSSSPIPIGTRKHKVELSIQNLNDYELSKITLHIPNQFIELNIEKIPAKDEVIQSLDIGISKEELVNIKDNIVTLQGYYSFYCLGEWKRDEIPVRIKIRKIVDVSETAEEFFKF